MVETKTESLLAAVLVRGTVGVRHDIRKALAALKLLKRNACVTLPDTSTHRGLMVKCKDYITYGPITKEMLSQLEKKAKGNVFHLHPPRGGYGRKGVKVSYQNGGALGLRAETMDEFLKRML